MLEYGVTNDASSADWNGVPPACPVILKHELRHGFEQLGASYAILWQKRDNIFEMVAGYTTGARRAALIAARGDDASFETRSREVHKLEADGNGPVNRAYTTGEEVFVADAGHSDMKRADLAKEFNIKNIHFVPVEGGVLEFGTPSNAMLTGSPLAATLKMRCDLIGAGYAMVRAPQNAAHGTPAKPPHLSWQHPSPWRGHGVAMAGAM